MGPQTPRNAGQFAKLVRQPGGMTADEAVLAASANLETLRGGLEAEIAAAIGAMQSLDAAQADVPDPASIDALYRLSNRVIGLAGLPGLRAVGQICFSLCELIDRLQTSRTWNTAAVRVHMDCLRALRPGSAGDEDQQDAVVAALRRVVGRI